MWYGDDRGRMGNDSKRSVYRFTDFLVSGGINGALNVG